MIWALVAVFTFTLDAFSASAKDKSLGMRMEIVSTEDNDNEFSVFSYQKKDGNDGYYMGIVREFDVSEVFGLEIFGGTVSHLDEVCLYLGSTAEEALASLDAMLELYDQDVDYAIEFPARLSTGSEQLGDPTTVTCVVKKKVLKGKFLRFFFVSGKHNADADLGKFSLKFLRKGLERDMKRNKD